MTSTIRERLAVARQQALNELDRRDLTFSQHELMFAQLEKMEIEEGQTVEITIQGVTKYPGITVIGNKALFHAVWGLLRRNGLKATDHIAERQPQFSCFWGTENEVYLIYFEFTSKVCMRRQVGTKMVEQPIFEVICDE